MLVRLFTWYRSWSWIFLKCSRGPQAISKYNNVTLKKGMILSNEPGYYKKIVMV